jgi:hypothetical protein
VKLRFIPRRSWVSIKTAVKQRKFNVFLLDITHIMKLTLRLSIFLAVLAIVTAGKRAFSHAPPRSAVTLYPHNSTLSFCAHQYLFRIALQIDG